MNRDFSGARRTPILVLVEHARDQLPETCRNRYRACGIESRRRRMENRVDDRGRRPSFERAAPGHHFVQDDAKREDVGPRVERIAQRLLGRHVQNRSNRGARIGERCRRLGGLGDRGKAEVEQLRVAARRDEDVRRLDVAVDDARRMRGVERIGDLHADVDDGSDRKRSAREPFVQREAAEQFHYEIRASVGFGGLADVVNRADIRMIEPRRGAGFALEAGQMFFRGGQRGGEQLERDVPVKRQIVCLVDLAHAAGADRSDDLESTGDADSWGQRHSLGDVMDPKTRRFYNGRCAFL